MNIEKKEDLIREIVAELSEKELIIVATMYYKHMSYDNIAYLSGYKNEKLFDKFNA